MEAPFAMLLRALNNPLFHFARWQRWKEANGTKRYLKLTQRNFLYDYSTHYRRKGLAIGKRIFEFIIHDEFGRMLNCRFSFVIWIMKNSQIQKVAGFRLGLYCHQKFIILKFFCRMSFTQKAEIFSSSYLELDELPIQLAQWTVKNWASLTASSTIITTNFLRTQHDVKTLRYFTSSAIILRGEWP